MQLLTAEEHHELLEEAVARMFELLRTVAKHGFVPWAERPPRLARMSCTGLVLSLNSEARRQRFEHLV